MYLQYLACKNIKRHDPATHATSKQFPCSYAYHGRREQPRRRAGTPPGAPQLSRVLRRRILCSGRRRWRRREARRGGLLARSRGSSSTVTPCRLTRDARERDFASRASTLPCTALRRGGFAVMSREFLLRLRLTCGAIGSGDLVGE
jgi:hypothetical protein